MRLNRSATGSAFSDHSSGKRSQPRLSECLIFIIIFLLTVPAFSSDVKIFRDDFGRRLELNHCPQRIISLAPNLTEILFALGLSQQVVGVTSFCDYPEEARQKEIIGGLVDPSLEKIKVLQPDLVLGFRGNPRRILDRLYEEKLPLQAFEIGKTFEDLFSLIERISRLTCGEDRWQELNSNLRERIKLIEARVPQVKAPAKVFLTLYGQGQELWTCGQNSYLNYLLNRAGLQNVAANFEGNWLAYNPEKLIADNPEIILILARNQEGFKQATKWLESLTPLREIKAIKNKNFIFLDENLFSRFGPRLVDAYEWLVKAVYLASEPERK